MPEEPRRGAPGQARPARASASTWTGRSSAWSRSHRDGADCRLLRIRSGGDQALAGVVTVRPSAFAGCLPDVLRQQFECKGVGRAYHREVAAVERGDFGLVEHLGCGDHGCVYESEGKVAVALDELATAL